MVKRNLVGRYTSHKDPMVNPFGTKCKDNKNTLKTTISSGDLSFPKVPNFCVTIYNTKILYELPTTSMFPFDHVGRSFSFLWFLNKA